MSILKRIFCCVCLIGLTQLIWSQNSNSSIAPGSRAHGVPGYLDPRTGTFTAKVHADASPVPDAVTYSVLTGSWVFTIPVTLNSKTQSGDLLACEIDLSVSDPVTNIYHEKSVSTVTSPGASPTCTVTIPYSWVLTAPTTDTVVISYDVSLIQAYTVGPVSAAESSRDTSRTYSYTEAVPANGATTSITINHITI